MNTTQNQTITAMTTTPGNNASEPIELSLEELDDVQGDGLLGALIGGVVGAVTGAVGGLIAGAIQGDSGASLLEDVGEGAACGALEVGADGLLTPEP
jgi:hypothetical protein